MLRALLICLLAALPAAAEEVVAGLSQSRISIATDFDGSEILIFGAVKREAGIPDEPLGVIITVEGPSEPLAVRRKDKRYGIWVNTDAQQFAAAPSFYAVNTSGAWEDMIQGTQDLRHRISINRAIEREDARVGALGFTRALIRIREKEGLYQTNIDAVEVSEDTLFSTSVRLPANLTEGDYRARFFLTRGGIVVDSHETAIAVQKVGLERFLFRLAHDQPLIYGLMSLAIAIFAGWAASAIFRFIRV